MVGNVSLDELAGFIPGESWVSTEFMSMPRLFGVFKRCEISINGGRRVLQINRESGVCLRKVHYIAKKTRGA